MGLSPTPSCCEMSRFMQKHELSQMDQWAQRAGGSGGAASTALSIPKVVSKAPRGTASQLSLGVADILRDNEQLQDQLSNANSRSMHRDGQLAHLLQTNDDVRSENQQLQTLLGEMSQQLRLTQQLSKVTAQELQAKPLEGAYRMLPSADQVSVGGHETRGQVFALGQENAALTETVQLLESRLDRQSVPLRTSPAAAFHQLEFHHAHSMELLALRAQCRLQFTATKLMARIAERSCARLLTAAVRDWRTRWTIDVHLRLAEQWRLEEQTLRIQVTRIKEELLSISMTTSAQSWVLRCQELEQQVAIERATNVGLSARMGQLNHLLDKATRRTQ